MGSVSLAFCAPSARPLPPVRVDEPALLFDVTCAEFRVRKWANGSYSITKDGECWNGPAHCHRAVMAMAAELADHRAKVVR